MKTNRELDKQELRRCLAKFATGVTVVTLAGPTGPRGLTVNAFTSVSLDPPLVLVSIAKKARTHALFEGRAFAVNVLRLEQEPLARHFSGHAEDQVDVAWVSGGDTARLEGTLAWLECEPWATYDAGDHSLYLGRIVDFGHSDGDALGFFSSHFVPIARPIPSEPPLPYDPFELPYDAVE